MKKLTVYRTEVETVFHPNGNVIVRATERIVWDAPFKDDAALLEAIIGFSNQGFRCTVT